MTIYKKIENAIRRNILLYKQLSELVIKEKNLFDRNRLNDISPNIERIAAIQSEIEDTNSTITALYGVIESDDFAVDDKQRGMLSALIKSLRKSVEETMRVVEKTGKTFQHMKQETVKDIRDSGRRKKALNTYVMNS